MIDLFTSARFILNKLESAGHEAFVVGGYVRDSLIPGRIPKDIDIVTSAKPEQVLALFPGADLVGAHFGVVIVKPTLGVSIEVATYRIDGQYADNRRPDSVSFTADVEADLARRDFTMNAILMDADGKIHDRLGGVDDIENKTIRAIGEPAKRFQEDALRMLRAIRFACQLNFYIENSTRHAISQNADLITRISAERVRDELSKMLTSGHARICIRILRDLCIAHHILPELIPMEYTPQNPKHHPEGDVFTHTLMLLEQLPKDCSLTLALAALLHDIGKPPTLGWKDGQPTFYGHDDVGAEMTRTILNRLRYSNDVIDTVVGHVKQHMAFHDLAKYRRGKALNFVHSATFPELLDLHKLDSRASCNDMRHAAFAESLLAEAPAAQRAPRLITGRDLIEMGLKPGPLFKKVLEECELAQLEGKLEDKACALRFAECVVTEMVAY
jgi:poly(A) polymerase